MEVPLTPLDFARRARKLYANREAVIDQDERFTYAQFFERCDRWSSALQGLGIQKGDRIAYIAPNTHAQLESFYAIPQLGAVLVPLNYRLIGSDFEYLIQHSGSRIVCAHSDYLDTVDEIRSKLPNVEHFVALEGSRTGWLNYEELIAHATPSFESPQIEETDLISINYTSGTTSRPKGVMITHRNAYINAVGTMIHIPMTRGERYLWTVPMFHANGWTFVWINTAAGAAHVCLRSVNPALVFETIRRERITMLCASPTVLISIVNAAPEIRGEVPAGIRVLTAGAPPAAATIEKVEKEFGWEITQVYGLTETAPFITVCDALPEHLELSQAERALVKARQGVELITSGELSVVDSHGVEVPHDGMTTGEIVVRGNVVMKGYYMDPDATTRAMQDGWFHSGDAAVVHPDGYVEIRDRLKDVIISGGENISSVEVEGVLLRHPLVQEVAVVGVPHEKWGESPHAYIVLKQGKTCDEKELRDFARSLMAHFKCPTGFTFVSELPKTATGKVQKYVLRGKRSSISRQ